MKFLNYISMNGGGGSADSDSVSTGADQNRPSVAAGSPKAKEKSGRGHSLVSRLSSKRRTRPPSAAQDTNQVLSDLSNRESQLTSQQQQQQQQQQQRPRQVVHALDDSSVESDTSLGIQIPQGYLSPSGPSASSTTPLALAESVTSNERPAIRRKSGSMEKQAKTPASSAADYQHSKDIHRLVMLAKHPNPAVAEHYGNRRRKVNVSKRTGGPVLASSSSAIDASRSNGGESSAANATGTIATSSSSSSSDSNGSGGDSTTSQSPLTEPLQFTVVAAGEMGHGSQEEWPIAKKESDTSGRTIEATFSQSTVGSSEKQAPRGDVDSKRRSLGKMGWTSWVSKVFSTSNDDLASVVGKERRPEPSIMSDNTPRISNVTHQKARQDVEGGLGSIAESEEDEDQPGGFAGWFRSWIKSRTGKIIFAAVIILLLAAIVIAVSTVVAGGRKDDGESDELGGLNFVPGSRVPRPPTPTIPPSPFPTPIPTQAPTKVVPTMKPTVDFLDTPFRAVGQPLAGEENGQWFGYSVALSKNSTVAVVGSPFANIGDQEHAGMAQAYLLNKEINEWAPIGSPLRGRFENDQFGSAVAISNDGRIIVVSEPSYRASGIRSGNVRAFRISRDWQEYLPLGQELPGLAASDLFGVSVSLSGDGMRLAIGAPYRVTASNDGDPIVSGQVRVYELNEDEQWQDLGDPLDGSEDLDWFGWAVDFNGDGNKLVVGAPRNLKYGGYGRCFELTADKQWRVLGDDITNSVSPRRYDDNFGYSVSFSEQEDRIAIGAPSKNFRGRDTGVAAVYHLSTTTNEWRIVGTPLSSQEPNWGDQFGYSVDLENDVLLVGVPGFESLGQARLYKFEQDDWVEHPDSFEGGTNSDFGVSVFLNSDKTVAIGGSAMDGSGPGFVTVHELRI